MDLNSWQAFYGGEVKECFLIMNIVVRFTVFRFTANTLLFSWAFTAILTSVNRQTVNQYTINKNQLKNT
jgi:hypothetical protein